MKKTILALTFVFAFNVVGAQSKTTEALQSRFDNSLSLYFYKNTLRMLNQSDNKDFDEMIRNIEKLKFLMVNKTEKNFETADYKKLMKDYQGESYESVLTSRMDGRNFDVYIRDVKGSTLGTVVLVNDSSSLFVLDIIGTIDLNKVGALFSTIDENTDIGEKIKGFMDHKKKDRDNKFNN
jgi:Domain of unknown function (DUF4252)